MPQGKIKRLVADRGFGFVEGDRDDVFFHHSEVIGLSFDDFREGQMMDYQIVTGPKGPRAEKIHPAEQPA